MDTPELKGFYRMWSRTENYRAAVAERGGVMWFNDPRKLSELERQGVNFDGADTDEEKARRLYQRRFEPVAWAS